MTRTLLLALLFAVPLAFPAAAQSVRLVGEFQDWSAYATGEGNGQICFVLTQPTAVAPRPDSFTEAYLYLTNRPAEGVRNEFNLVAGYSFAPDSTAVASVGGQRFELFTQADAAWLLDPARSDALAAAIRAGSSLTVEGTTERGIKVSESFSLAGATAASRAIEGGC